MTDNLPSWSELADRAVADPAELKARLDLVAVCEEVGIALDGADDRWQGLCPFHDDTDPSFSVYETDDGFQRCGCFACDFGPSNDVFDLLQRLRGYGFAAAVREAQALSVATRATGPRERRTPVARPAVDLEPFVTGAYERAIDDRGPIAALLHDRGINVPADWLLAEFRLGVTPDGFGVVVPHYQPDGSVRAAKVRRRSEDGIGHPWRPTAVTGSKLDQLYGVWRDRGKTNVVLVEGESDAWTTAWLTRGYEVDVLALPSGASARPRREWLEYLGDRDVTLLLDADDGGRLALKNWAAALGVVKVAQLDEGLDATSSDPKRVLEAIAHAQTLGTSLAAGLVEAPFGGYVRASDDDQVPVANFTLRLSRTVAFENEGNVYEVTLPNGHTRPIETSAFGNEAEMRRWSNRHDFVWYGNTRDGQELLRILLNERPFAALARGTRVAGLHDGHFVLPDGSGGTVGGASWAYVAPHPDAPIDPMLNLQPGQWDAAVPVYLAHLHRPDVITPLIGWVAAAPLRSLIRSFPVMAVVGPAGWGKSTVVRETLHTFGYAIEANLTSTTPYGLSQLIESTNAFPVWVDEYRRGARADAKTTFEQLMRDAWDAQASFRGGVGENKSALHATRAAAPIVVTGEDVFSETSHLERLVMIQIPQEGRGEAAYARLETSNRAGMGRSYLEWLVERLRSGTLPVAPNLHNRPAHARAVARWGYGLYTSFVREIVGAELPEWDESMIAGAHDTSSQRPALLDILDEMRDRSNRHGQIVWVQGEDLCVRVPDLVKEANELGMPLPGGNKAVEAELVARFDAERDRDTFGLFWRLRGAMRG